VTSEFSVEESHGKFVEEEQEVEEEGEEGVGL
jgi:hypothetical protein